MYEIDKAIVKGAKNITNRIGEIIVAENGSYLIEVDRFVRLSNGRIVYTIIENYKGFVIKFNKNGIYNYAIFNGKVSLEDGITSLAKVRQICDKLNSK